MLAGGGGFETVASVERKVTVYRMGKSGGGTQHGGGPLGIELPMNFKDRVCTVFEKDKTRRPGEISAASIVNRKESLKQHEMVIRDLRCFTMEDMIPLLT